MPLTEIELEAVDERVFMTRLSDQLECEVVAEGVIQLPDGRLREFFSIVGATSGEVLTAIESYSDVDEPKILRETDDSVLLEVVLSGSCYSSTLAGSGAIVRKAAATDGSTRIMAEVPSHADTARAIELFTEVHPHSKLLCRRDIERDGALITDGDVRDFLLTELTDRQFEAVKTAYMLGYFSWPRDASARDCAEALGITQSTFSELLRSAEKKLFRTLFDDDTSNLVHTFS